ncbi:MAG TPA: diacylglycerol kinase family protein [Thermoanaerobaculia bacterium]|nr:diacylglycerol kinase family protein [Thermoanaerobaculia bacterium]
MNSKGALFFNPSSGVRPGAAMDPVRAAVESRGLDFIPVGPDTDLFAEIRRRLEKGERLFIAAGGDGTINHVVQPLVHTEGVLGVVPLGTFNHFARDLKIPIDWHAALDVALRGEIRQIDTARVNDRSFVNNISLGLYPELVTQRERFRGHGRLKAYRYALRWGFEQYPHVSLVVEAPPHYQAIRTHVFMVSVNPYDFSGFGIEAPRATLEGGELSVYWLPHMPRVHFIRAIARYLAGKISAVDGLHSVRTSQLKIQTSGETIRLGMDGEVLEMMSPLTITVVPRSLLVRVPRT